MEKGKSKIFIISSGRALTLAKELQSQLFTNFSEATVWSQESAGKLSGTIITMLEGATKSYDFAVIILTEDDLVFKGGGDEEQRKARDNCIFEAGLFMGTLGKGRCFLLVSIDQEALPSDLSGLIYQRFEAPNDLDDYKLCEKAMQIPSTNIIENIQAAMKEEAQEQEQGQNKLCLPRLLAEDLFAREKHKSKGGILEEGQVVVSATQPLEDKYDFAVQVKQNMDDGIKYVYFFFASDDGATKICKILQMILLAEMIKDQAQGESFKERSILIKNNQQRVLEILQEIRDRETLKICFLPNAPYLEFCIHNATDTIKAKAYFKKEKDFVMWCEGEKANGIWGDLKKLCGKELPKGIFHSTMNCKINEFKLVSEALFKNSLDRELKSYFLDIYEDVKKRCYSDEDQVCAV